LKQVFIDQGDGSVFVEEVPPPILTAGNVLVSATHSVISSETELSKVQMGEPSLLAKTRNQTDLERKIANGLRQVEGHQNAIIGPQRRFHPALRLIIGLQGRWAART
jgi:hypothetical protein